jgi:hypothetical protein
MRDRPFVLALVGCAATTAFLGCEGNKYSSQAPATELKKVPSTGTDINKSGTNASAINTSANANANGTGASGSGSGSTSNSSPTANGSGVVFAPDVPEQDALKKCLSIWKSPPFTEVTSKQVKVMDLVLSAGSISLGNTKDLEATSAPRLVVIPLSVTIANTTNFELMNPNGWYCLKLAVAAQSTINIKMHCDAKITQSELVVNVDSTGSTTVANGTSLPVGVSVNGSTTSNVQSGILVDSSVVLTRVDSNGAPCK